MRISKSMEALVEREARRTGRSKGDRPRQDKPLHRYHRADLLPALRKGPRIRFALDLGLYGVLDQTQLLQAREQLRDLALVADAGGVGHLAVGGEHSLSAPLTDCQ